MDGFSLVPAPPCGAVEESLAAPGYLMVCIGEDGRFNLQGSRQEVEEFLIACAESGMHIQMDYLSWCG